MNPVPLVLTGLLALSIIFILVWVSQLFTLNAGMVDPVWSYSLGLLALVYATLAGGDATARLLTGILGGAWGLRLGSHLLRRNFGKPEDGRYRRLREEWGTRANLKMFWFFQLQVVLAVLLSAGFLVVCLRADAPHPVLIAAAVLVWIISVGGEALSDWQLEKFKADPTHRGRVCRTGLWRYSRHPNYFFECLHWPVYTILAIGSPWVLVTLLPVGVMAFLLLKVSGVPMTEQQTARSRPEYADYIRTTSAFIPWPPRRSPEADA
jgi:steroid 5-alpha reductase family enzyme